MTQDEYDPASSSCRPKILTAKTARFVTVASCPPESESPPKRVRLICQGMGIAVVTLPPAPGKGYLLVEGSDGRLWWEEIEVPAEGKTFDVQLDPSWAR